ncbi:hypothetical protein KAH37_03045 [bacterium]|nr:hypothetical protein [bacterium]
MSIIDLIGFIPAVIFPAATLLQVIHLLKVKNSEGVSALSWAAFAIGNISVYIYMEKYSEIQAIATFIGTFVLQVYLVILVLKYRK